VKEETEDEEVVFLASRYEIECSQSFSARVVNGYGLLDNTSRLSQSVVQSIATMIGADAQDGVRHL
jgi:hypothetical protein